MGYYCPKIGVGLTEVGVDLFRVKFLIFAGWQKILSNIPFKSLMKMLKRIRLKLQPCLSPMFEGKRLTYAIW